MKIQTIKPVATKELIIPIGEVLKVRPFRTWPFDFDPPYQVIGGPYSGICISRECCINFENEKTYTEKQWKDLQDFHKKELEQAYQQKERAQHLVTNLTESIKKRNAKIESLEYCVNVLAGSLHAMTEAFHKLKALEKFRNR
jgi:hypothetical protein